jgi:alpha-L-fucosidase
LVAELAEACEAEGLGFFLYYSHGRDWRHPHAPNNDKWGGSARPQYDPPEPSYKYGAEHDLNIYVEFMTRQVTELLTMFPTVAGIWLDGIAVPRSGDFSLFKCQELYDLIHRLSPHAIFSYKQGLLGTEDFFAPEHKIPTEEGAGKGKIGEKPDKLIEICTTMIKDPPSWGYAPNPNRLSEEEIWEKLREAGRGGGNLLLNTGPLPDGSLDPLDEPILRKVGTRIRAEGFPG